MTTTQQAKIRRGHSIIGEVFTARKGFPAKHGADKWDKTFIQDIAVGENFKVLSYEESRGIYTLLNLELGTSEAWFEVDNQELDYLLRRGETR